MKRECFHKDDCVDFEDCDECSDFVAEERACGNCKHYREKYTQPFTRGIFFKDVCVNVQFPTKHVKKTDYCAFYEEDED